MLPPSSLVGVETRRLARAEIAWQDSAHPAAPVDPEQIYCCPQRYEAEGSYGAETRIEWADRYGGTGTGAAGGKGSPNPPSPPLPRMKSVERTVAKWSPVAVSYSNFS